LDESVNGSIHIRGKTSQIAFVALLFYAQNFCLQTNNIFLLFGKNIINSMKNINEINQIKYFNSSTLTFFPFCCIILVYHCILVMKGVFVSSYKRKDTFKATNLKEYHTKLFSQGLECPKKVNLWTRGLCPQGGESIPHGIICRGFCKQPAAALFLTHQNSTSWNSTVEWRRLWN
jgi:hypothetical protein